MKKELGGCSKVPLFCERALEVQAVQDQIIVTVFMEGDEVAEKAVDVPLVVLVASVDADFCSALFFVLNVNSRRVKNWLESEAFPGYETVSDVEVQLVRAGQSDIEKFHI